MCLGDWFLRMHHIYWSQSNNFHIQTNKNTQSLIHLHSNSWLGKYVWLSYIDKHTPYDKLFHNLFGSILSTISGRWCLFRIVYIFSILFVFVVKLLETNKSISNNYLAKPLSNYPQQYPFVVPIINQSNSTNYSKS
jgi:hypothetical protein